MFSKIMMMVLLMHSYASWKGTQWLPDVSKYKNVQQKSQMAVDMCLYC